MPRTAKLVYNYPKLGPTLAQALELLMVPRAEVGQAVEEQEGWLLPSAMPLATAMHLALVGCHMVVAFLDVQVEFAWRARCRVVALNSNSKPSCVLVAIPPDLKPRMVAIPGGVVDLFLESLQNSLPWRLVAAQWQP